MELGQALARAREKRGMTQRELAERANVSKTYLSQIENGKKEPLISTLRAIAAAIDVPLPVLLFLSMSELDVSPAKRDAYRMLAPSLLNIIDHLFLEQK